MQKQYGVVWRDGDLALATGKLDLGPRALRLEGLAGSRAVSSETRYEDVTAVRVGRLNGDRINGRPTVVVERRKRPHLAIAPFADPGAVGEIVERVSVLQSGAADAVAEGSDTAAGFSACDVVTRFVERALPTAGSRTVLN